MKQIIRRLWILGAIAGPLCAASMQLFECRLCIIKNGGDLRTIPDQVFVSVKPGKPLTAVGVKLMSGKSVVFSASLPEPALAQLNSAKHDVLLTLTKESAVELAKVLKPGAKLTAVAEEGKHLVNRAKIVRVQQPK